MKANVTAEHAWLRRLSGERIFETAPAGGIEAGRRLYDRMPRNARGRSRPARRAQ